MTMFDGKKDFEAGRRPARRERRAFTARMRRAMRRFGKSDAGAVAMVFGLTFIPIMAASGVGFDYAKFTTAKHHMDAALDAGGLAAANQLYETEAKVQQIAQTYFDKNLENDNLLQGEKQVQVLEKTSETLRIAARGHVDTSIMRLFNQPKLDVYSEAEFTRKFRGIEAALVLDITGSMSGSKIENMREFAKDLIDILYGNQSRSDYVRVGLVPFTDMVNIKATRPNFKGELPDFSVSGTFDPADIDPHDRTVQNAQIRDHYTGTAWEWIDVTGEATYNGWNIDDHRYVEVYGDGGINYRTGWDYDSQYSSDPFEFGTDNKGDRLEIGQKFVPCSHHKAKGCEYEALRNDHLWLYQQIDVQWDGCVESRPIVDLNGVQRDLDIQDVPPNPADPDTLFVPSFHADGGGNGFHSFISDRNEYSRDNGPKLPTNYMDRLHLLNKYYEAKPDPDDYGGWAGPNKNCARPVTPLQDEKQVLVEEIDALEATYSTNIPAGLAWGWRLLSPEAPFTAGLPYGHLDEDGTRWEKAIVLLTDGENWTSSKRYNSYGFHHEDRLTGPENESDPRDAMDNRLAKLCENVKNAGKNQGGDGITLYVIAFEMSGSVKDELFKPCATSPGHFFDAQNAEELRLAFNRIGADLANLWISE